MAEVDLAGQLPLAEFIQNLRAQLMEAVRAGANAPLQFRLGEIELELKVTASREVGAKGGVKFWVLNFGASAKVKDSEVQVVKLKLTPVDPRSPKGSGEVVVNDQKQGQQPQ